MEEQFQIQLNKTIKVCANSLIFCEGDRNYTNLHFTNRKMLTIPKTLKKVVMDISDQSFIRIHKKYLINLKYLKKIEGDYITLANDYLFTIARRRQATIYQAIQKSKI